MAATAGPPLQLSDIIHTTTPTPFSPENKGSQPSSLEDEETEPLTSTDISAIRRRLAEMGFVTGEGSIGGTSRENELAQMILRLTESPLVDPSQLIQQAAVISELTAQRDYLIYQSEEEKKLWATQKEDWHKMAEALIAQRNKQLGSSSKDPELERVCSAYESDNRALRDKLHDTQQRLQALEAELNKLKPILLMQPFATAQSSLASIQHASSFLSSLPYPSAGAPIPPKPKSKKRKVEQREPLPLPVVATAKEDREPRPVKPVTEQPKPDQPAAPSTFLQFQAAPGPNQQQPRFSGDHYRRPVTPAVGGPLAVPPTTLSFQINSLAEDPVSESASTPAPSSPDRHSAPAQTLTPQPQAGPSFTRSNDRPTQVGRPNASSSSRNAKAKPSNSIAIHPLSADARSEHLLLAARKIGRERAGIVVGYLRSRQAESDVQVAEKENPSEASKSSDMAHNDWDRQVAPTSHYRLPVNGVGAPPTPKRATANGKQPDNPPSGAKHSPRPSTAVSPSSPGKGNIHAEKEPQETHAQQTPTTPRLQPSRPHLLPPQHLAPAPNTPLSSLLDAARMMDDERANTSTSSPHHHNVNDPKPKGATGAHGRGRRRGAAAALDSGDSPPAKRRRVNSTRGSSVTTTQRVERESVPEKEEGTQQKDVPRVRSALDVLADQAAFFSSTPHQPGPSSRAKGKEKEVAPPDSRDEADPEGAYPKVEKPLKVVKGRGKAKSKAQGKGKEKQVEPPKPKRAPRAPPRDRSSTTTQPNQERGTERANPSHSRVIKTAATGPRVISVPEVRLSQVEEISAPSAPTLRQSGAPQTLPASVDSSVVEGQETGVSNPAGSPAHDDQQSEPANTTSIPPEAADSQVTLVDANAPGSSEDRASAAPGNKSPYSAPETADTRILSDQPSTSPPMIVDPSPEASTEQIAERSKPPSHDFVPPSDPPRLENSEQQALNAEVQQHQSQDQGSPRLVPSESQVSGFLSKPIGVNEQEVTITRRPSPVPFVGPDHTPDSTAIASSHDGTAANGGSSIQPEEAPAFLTDSSVSTPSTSQLVELLSTAGSRVEDPMTVDREHDAESVQAISPRTLSTEIRAANLQTDSRPVKPNEDADAEGDLDAEGEEDAEGEVDSEIEVPLISPTTAHLPSRAALIDTGIDLTSQRPGSDAGETREIRMGELDGGSSSVLP